MGTPEEEVQKEAGNFLGDFIEGVIGKFKNPFFFTFITIWIIHNWKIVYAFFNFEKDTKLKEKLAFFDNYWSINHFGCNLLIVAIYSVVALVISYLVFWLTSYLIGYYKFNLLPKSIKRTRGDIVTFAEYEDAVNKRSKYYSLYRTAQKDAIEATDQRNSIEKEKLELNQEIEQMKSVIQNISTEKAILQQTLSQEKIEYQKLTERNNYSEDKVIIFANFVDFLKKFTKFVDVNLPLQERESSVGLTSQDKLKLFSYYEQFPNSKYLKEDEKSLIYNLSSFQQFFIFYYLCKTGFSRIPFIININALELVDDLVKIEIFEYAYIENVSNSNGLIFTEKGISIAEALLYNFLNSN